jgi:AcrR family transcriptional regulator
MGRPSLYTDAIADEIITRLSDGEPLRQICRDIGVGKSAVYRWLDEKEESFCPQFAGRFARARAEGFEAISEDCLEIADDARNDWMERRKPDGEVDKAFDAEHVQRSKLRIETRLKLLAKWDPKRYGDKLELAGDKTSPLVVQVVRLTDADDPPASG